MEIKTVDELVRLKEVLGLETIGKLPVLKVQCSNCKAHFFVDENIVSKMLATTCPYCSCAYVPLRV